MNVKTRNIVFGLTVALACSSIMGQAVITATVSGDGGITDVRGTVKPVHPAATGAEGGFTFDLFLDSAADILVIDATLSGCLDSVFNVTDPALAATDHTPPSPALLNVPGFGDLNADLWITTPGVTSAADASSLTAGDTVAHFDESDDGPQSGFHWASFTLLTDSLDVPDVTLRATIQTAADPIPMSDEIHVTLNDLGGVGNCVPEPDSLNLIAVLLGGLTFARRSLKSR